MRHLHGGIIRSVKALMLEKADAQKYFSGSVIPRNLLSER